MGLSRPFICEDPVEKSGSLDSFHYRYSIFIFQLQSKLANMPSLCIFPSEPCLPTIISTDILCANAVIDTFITSKEIQFSFQSSTGMNSATSSVANNEGPLPWAKGWLRLLYAFKGKSVSNCFPTPTFVLGKWRQLSDRLVSNFIVRQMSFLFGAMVITGLRHRCSSAVKPAVSPFNTLTLMSVADCQVQTWHPLSLHYVKRVTCRIHASVLRGRRVMG